jgi:hypothetical protein
MSLVAAHLDAARIAFVVMVAFIGCSGSGVFDVLTICAVSDYIITQWVSIVKWFF